MKNQRQEQFICLMEEQRQDIISEHHSAQAEVFIRTDFFSHANENQEWKMSLPTFIPPPSLNLEGLTSELVTSENPSPVAQTKWSASELPVAFDGSVRDQASSSSR